MPGQERDSSASGACCLTFPGGLEAVVDVNPLNVVGQRGVGQQGPVSVDVVDGEFEGQLLGADQGDGAVGLLENAAWTKKESKKTPGKMEANSFFEWTEGAQNSVLGARVRSYLSPTEPKQPVGAPVSTAFASAISLSGGGGHDRIAGVNPNLSVCHLLAQVLANGDQPLP